MRIMHPRLLSKIRTVTAVELLDYLLIPVCIAEPYAKLARQMALPQTACLALPGPIGPVPGTPTGRAWYNEEDEEEHATVRHTSWVCCCM